MQGRGKSGLRSAVSGRHCEPQDLPGRHYAERPTGRQLLAMTTARFADSQIRRFTDSPIRRLADSKDSQILKKHIMSKRIFTLGLLLLWSSLSLAQAVLSPQLEDQLQSAAENQSVRAIVLLEDRLDIQALDQRLYEQNATLEERAAEVITSLQTHAAQTQSALLAQLEQVKGTAAVEVTPLWIINGIIVDAPPDAILTLANHADARYIYHDVVLQCEFCFPIRHRTSFVAIST